MTNIDQLEGLPLIKAFVEALGFKAVINIDKEVLAEKIPALNRGDWLRLEELPANLILKEFNRIRPEATASNSEVVQITKIIGNNVYQAEGPNLEIAMARLVCKLEKEKI